MVSALYVFGGRYAARNRGWGLERKEGQGQSRAQIIMKEQPEGAVNKLSENEKEEGKRFEELFNRLDVNKDGTIDIKELTAALRGVADASKHAKKMLHKADIDTNTRIDFGEFVQYMRQHEHKLRLAFSSLDRNNDGKIEPSEIRTALSQLGIHISLEEAQSLTAKLDTNKDLGIDWNEWRDFFNLYPSDNLQDMFDIWLDRPMIDIGEQLTCPPEFQSKGGVSWRHLVAGGIAGSVSRTATAPLDRLKVMLQVYGSKTEMRLLDGMWNMIKEGGIRSLWRGNGTSVVKIAPESAFKFAAYEEIKRLMVGESGKEITVKERFAAGSIAGAIAQTAIFPMEVVKTRLAISTTGQYTGLLDCGLKILKKEGIRSFYRGYLPNLIGIIPYAGIDLTIYETLKLMYLRNHPDRKDPGVIVLLLCGSVSSTCGQLASYPLALIRTRLQAQATEDAKGGPMALAKNIIKTEGLKGLYRGLLPNFIKVLPAVSISYVVYEHTKSLLGL